MHNTKCEEYKYFVDWDTYVFPLVLSVSGEEEEPREDTCEYFGEISGHGHGECFLKLQGFLLLLFFLTVLTIAVSSVSKGVYNKDMKY